MLRGSNYYNPAWGRQAGDVRNSRVRREGLPLSIVAYCGRIGGSTLLRASAAVETGIRCQSSLAWYDASTPRPDNYHYLPSYFTFEAVDAVWRTGDERYTQIDWAELYRRNRMQPDGEALYALEDRVERPLRMQAAIRIESEVDPQLTVACALKVDYDALRRYKQLRDLLGADRLTDIDHFLLDDATYSNRLQNDLRHPDRTVGEGDRFGYDYRTVRCEVAADGVVRYRSDRWTAAFGASASLGRRKSSKTARQAGQIAFGRDNAPQVRQKTCCGNSASSTSVKRRVKNARRAGKSGMKAPHSFPNSS